ncbi:putative RNA-binding protein YlmH [Lentibacillus sp. JNUCC-1]|uniref:YlmH family RNA-binding protein n=1 Tax=Lentibacillus sp. JNUCC-1 TaxID=2654513 RepID=UPI00132B4E06|nr:putative RNA-binding protein YlmH [Lentibacillus sp. JNUCC-1]
MDVYQHFRKDEHPFIDQVLSWREMVERQYQPKLTDFLDPREQDIVRTLAGSENDDLNLELFGGSEYAEQKRAIIAPYYETISEENFDIVLMETSFPEQFVSISHRDVLGAFLSLGIKRQKLGDIIVGEGVFQMILAREIADYTMVHLDKVKHASIQLQEKPLKNLLDKKSNWIEKQHIAASLRLDVILRDIYHLSRNKAVQYIKSGYVKVNFKRVDDVAFQLREGDLLSVRGKGEVNYCPSTVKQEKGI